MSRAVRLVFCTGILLWLFLCNTSVRAGAIMTDAFEPGRPLPSPLLENVPVKAVVSEFLDADESGLGKELGFLIWREILTAISDQKGVGVILARPPGSERLTDLLRSDYHDAALRIATSQKARMAVWGAVDEHMGRVTIETYLTLLGETRNAELALLLKSEGDTVLSARISRITFNFAPVSVLRNSLFTRSLVTRVDTKVRAKPGEGPVLATVPIGTVLQANDMRSQWFSVKLPDERAGYVDIANVEVPPRDVDVPVGENLKARPGVASATVATIDAKEVGRVLDMRYLPKGGLWYRVATAKGDGWVAGWRARPRFSLPAVHFIAGLYRYQMSRWDDAIREFEQFVRAPGVEADNASLSSAYQLLGASRLMLASQNGDVRGASGWEDDFAQALRQTPYDPSAYTMRGVARVGVLRRLDGATGDFANALELDPSHADARDAVTRIDGYLRGTSSSWRGIRISPPDTMQRERIESLVTKYRLRTY